MLSASLFSQDANEHAATLAGALACVKELQRRDASVLVADLKAQIRDAERRGDWDTAISLAKNLTRSA